jgi:uncharacterized Rossmann fold enzyme
VNIAFVCVNVGPRYGMEYASILRDMVLRNCSTMPHECAWFCITDRPDELPEGVYPIPADPSLPGYWQKLRLFSPDMPWEEGQRVVYFDLDVAITGRLEDLVERKGIIRDWHWPMFNSSVMVWDHGEHRVVWDVLQQAPDLINKPSPDDIAKLLPKGAVNGGDQEVITEVSRQTGDHWDTFPAEWFVSYRSAKTWPPSDAKAVIFHGEPKPADVTDGWVPNVWKIGGMTSLPQMSGVNTTEDLRFANIKSSIQRDLPWFTGFRDEGRTAVLVCGAPSMRDHVADIRWHKRHGARIVSVNNAWRFLEEHNITPDVHVMLDARPENAEFVKDAPRTTRYVLASQCHPDVFDALADREVVLWHNAFGDHDKIQSLLELLKPYDATHPIVLVPGGCTVGLRSLWLCALSGFRRVHVYGMDSSYADNGQHHAYPQPLNDGEQVIEVVMAGKRYRCAAWMARQAEEFKQAWADLRNYRTPDGQLEPVTIHVHGRGLIPDMARALRAEERAAA